MFVREIILLNYFPSTFLQGDLFCPSISPLDLCQGNYLAEMFSLDFLRGGLFFWNIFPRIFVFFAKKKFLFCGGNYLVETFFLLDFGEERLM